MKNPEVVQGQKEKILYVMNMLCDAMNDERQHNL